MFDGCSSSSLSRCPGSANCSVHWIEQQIDHFNWAPPFGNHSHTTYKQRYFIYDRFWKQNAPVFFYLGNEDNVELYVNHTGLMWESAAEFSALLVFAEHRYYGASLPYAAGTPQCMNFLTSEQAMADFAYLIAYLREERGASESAFIGFGGSYGGMLAAWFRVHYPNAIAGAVAASAPIWSFPRLSPPYDDNAFNKAVTLDASAAGGASDACKDGLKAAWPRILAAAKTDKGRRLLGEAFRTCAPVRPRSAHADDAYSIVQWAQGVWGTLAMGNYPYASSYLLHGESSLPPWPLRAACAFFDGVGVNAPDAALFNAVRAAAATVRNASGDARCFDIGDRHRLSTRDKMTSPVTAEWDEELWAEQAPTRTMEPAGAGAGAADAATPAGKEHVARAGARGVDSNARAGSERAGAAGATTHATAAPGASCKGSWGYQWCTEMVQPFTQGTADDLFFCPNGTFYAARNCSSWDFEASARGCESSWGVRPRPEWARVALGGKRIEDASNIVFSNGLQDPWHGGGVLRNLSSSLLAVIIPNGAHHIDLMFSDDADALYPDVLWARRFERAQIRKWVNEHARQREGELAALLAPRSQIDAA